MSLVICYTQSMQKVLLSAILFFLVLISFALFFFFYETNYFQSRASVKDISVANSYVFMNPMKAQADGKDKITVTVMILNQNGLGVLGKKPVIGVDPRVTINKVQDTTNSLGEAVFEFSSTTPGDYSCQITVDDQNIPQKSMLSFYQ